MISGMKLQIPEIPENLVLDPTINKLVELLQVCLRIIQELTEENAHLKDEIAKLKGQKPRPKLSPSRTADDAKNKPPPKNSDIHRSSSRRQRKKEQKTVLPNNIPAGSIFKGYDTYNVQDLRIESLEIQFRLASI